MVNDCMNKRSLLIFALLTLLVILKGSYAQSSQLKDLSRERAVVWHGKIWISGIESSSQGLTPVIYSLDASSNKTLKKEIELSSDNVAGEIWLAAEENTLWIVSSNSMIAYDGKNIKPYFHSNFLHNLMRPVIHNNKLLIFHYENDRMNYGYFSKNRSVKTGFFPLPRKYRFDTANLHFQAISSKGKLYLFFDNGKQVFYRIGLPESSKDDFYSEWNSIMPIKGVWFSTLTNEGPEIFYIRDGHLNGCTIDNNGCRNTFKSTELYFDYSAVYGIYNIGRKDEFVLIRPNPINMIKVSTFQNNREVKSTYIQTFSFIGKNALILLIMAFLFIIVEAILKAKGSYILQYITITIYSVKYTIPGENIISIFRNKPIVCKYGELRFIPQRNTIIFRPKIPDKIGNIEVKQKFGLIIFREKQDGTELNFKVKASVSVLLLTICFLMYFIELTKGDISNRSMVLAIIMVLTVAIQFMQRLKAESQKYINSLCESIASGELVSNKK